LGASSTSEQSKCLRFGLEIWPRRGITGNAFRFNPAHLSGEGQRFFANSRPKFRVHGSAPAPRHNADRQRRLQFSAQPYRKRRYFLRNNFKGRAARTIAFAAGFRTTPSSSHAVSLSA
jgi:hypothetical protein